MDEEDQFFSFMDFDISEIARNGCFPVLNIALNNLELYNLDLNYPDKSGNCLLHYSAAKGNLETTVKLLSLKASADVLNAHGHTPLHLACLNNHKLIVEFLLESNAKINVKDYSGETPLSLALRSHDISLINLLISNGADVKTYTKTRNSLLHIATEIGDKNEVELLIIKYELDVDYLNSCGETPLLIAVQHNFHEIVDLLLMCKAKFDFVDHNKNSLLHVAVGNNNIQISTRLIKLPTININHLNNEGASALHLAAANNNTDIIRVLVENGAFIDQKDVDGHTPLHVAAGYKDNGAAVEMLLKLNATIDLITFDGDLPLHRAATSGNEEAVMLLFRCELINLRNRSSYTPLMMAEINDRISIVYLLKKLTGDIKDIENDTQLSEPNILRKRVSFTGIPVRRLN